MHLKTVTVEDAKTYILDNGAYTAKVGPVSASEPKIMPNCIMKVKSERRRPFIGDQIEECRDTSGLYYMLAFQKGFITNWDIQKTVWDYIFGKDCLNAKLNESTVIITEPLFNFHSLQSAMNEIFFEDYECHAMLRCSASDLSAYKHRCDTGSNDCIVVDSGYSFTHIVPYIDGKRYNPGIKRIDVGGKFLTNHLKEIISYRQLHVMDETYVINQAKEDACYVSQNFIDDMRRAYYKNDNFLMREYVLPDYSYVRRGYLRGEPGAPDSGKHPELDHIQTLKLCNERISVPELLFSPSDIGINQMGIPDAIVDCVSAFTDRQRLHLLENIVLTGGNTFLKGYKERVYKEVRSRCEDLMLVNVTQVEHPVADAWFGGKLLAYDEEFQSMTITKTEYDESGHNVRFNMFD